MLEHAAGFADREGTLLLHSSGPYETARRSFLFLFPVEQIIVDDRHRGRHIRNGRCTAYTFSDPWAFLQEKMGSFDGGSDWPKWSGYLGYEMGASAHSEKPLPYFDTPLPDAYFQRSAVTLRMEERLEMRADEEALFSFSREKILKEFREGPPLELDSAAYCRKVEQALELIREGELYQLNLSRDRIFAVKSSPFAFFQKRVKERPAPFSAFLNLGSAQVVSSSPERFLCSRGGELETRPIKGTAPRGRSREEDLFRREALLASEKEQAELLMITDLMRNDLAGVSLPGSLKVEKLRRCEAYANVFHLLSVIKAQAASDLGPLQIVRACFPGGSVTGCPKLRAMEAIADLEGRGRGIYTGSIGYFSENGDFDLNIAIRTAVVSAGRANLKLGSGIVYDSDPRLEYEETEHKR